MSTAALQNIYKTFGNHEILSGVSFVVNPGDKIALIGANGSGKTTILRLLTGEVMPDENSGSLTRPAPEIISYVSQNMSLTPETAELLPLDDPKFKYLQTQISQIEALLAATTVSDRAEHQRLLQEHQDLCDRFNAMDGFNYVRNLQNAMRKLGLKAKKLELPLKQLSGGEIMRVELARALVSNPRLLLLDEPTNHLDLAAISFLENYLQNFKGALLFVSHDRAFINNVADKIYALACGKLKTFNGNYDSYLQQKAENAKAQEKRLELLQQKLLHQEAVTQTLLSHRNIKSYHSSQKKNERLKAELEELKTQIEKSGKPLRFNFNHEQTNGSNAQKLSQNSSLAASNQSLSSLSSDVYQDNAPGKSGQSLRKNHKSKMPVLTVENLSFKFADTNDFLFENLNFQIFAGEHIVITGNNGAGKTTLIKILLRQRKATSGKVTSKENLRMGLLEQLTGFSEETDSAYALLCKAYPNLTETKLRGAMAKFGFTGDKVFSAACTLSGGELTRLKLLFLTLQRPDIIFLDEPTNHLDIDSRELLEQAINSYDGTVVVISHDRYFVAEIAHKVFELQNGKLCLHADGKFLLQTGQNLNLQTSVAKAKAPNIDVSAASTKACNMKNNVTANPGKEQNVKTQVSSSKISGVAHGATDTSIAAVCDTGKTATAEQDTFSEAELADLPKLKEFTLLLPELSKPGIRRKAVALYNEIYRETEQKLEKAKARSAELEKSFVNCSDPNVYHEYSDLQNLTEKSESLLLKLMLLEDEIKLK